LTPPIRVLWVIKTLGFGGAEILLARLAPNVSRPGVRVDCAYSDDRFHELVPALTAAGVDVHLLSTPGRRLSWVLRLLTLIKSGNYDVVHSHSPLLAAVSRLAVRLSRRGQRIVHITTEHNLRTSYHSLTRLVTALTSRWDGHCIAVSEMVGRSIQGAVRERMSVRYQGVDIAALDLSAGDPASRDTDCTLRLLCVANLRPQKGFPTLFEACRSLNAAGVEYHLNVVGVSASEVARSIQDIPSSLGIQDRVSFLGTRSDVPSLMRTHDLLVIASDYEAGPVVALEAAALGLPIVSTRVGIMAELFTDGVDCLLVEVGDHDSLSRAIIRLQDDIDLRMTVAANARRLVETIRLDEVADQLVALYHDCVAAA